MTVDARTEQVLIALARANAPLILTILQEPASFESRLARLARALADFNVLVLVGDQPYSLQNLTLNISTQIQSWVDGYLQFYLLLSHALFPSLTRVSVQHTDDRWPVIVALRGLATPVIQVMAGLVVPYITRRQWSAQVSDVELAILMDAVLAELNAETLPRDARTHLRAEGVALLRQLLAAPLRQIPLLEFDRPFFQGDRLVPPPRVRPPAHLPEAHLDAVRPEPFVSMSADTESLMPTLPMQSATTLPEQEPSAETDQPHRPHLHFFRFGRRAHRPPVAAVPGKTRS